MSQGHEHVTTYCMYIHRHKGYAHPLPQATDLQSDRFHDPCMDTAIHGMALYCIDLLSFYPISTFAAWFARFLLQNPWVAF